jgi:ribosomal protein L24
MRFSSLGSTFTQLSIEFLDDEPVHAVPAASSFRPVADDSDDDGDELRAIAQHYEDAAARELAVPQYVRPAAPVAPRPPIPLAAGSWIRHRGELSLVVSSRELLQVKDRKFKKKTVKNDLTDKTHRPVFPIREHTEPFRLAESQGSHPSIAKTAFVGLCPALAPGDRVVVVSGEFQHKMGQLYIWSLREVLRDNKRVRMAKIAEFNDGRDKLGRFDVEVCHLKRHILDAFCPIQMHDRICVVSGLLHRGLSGRVTDVSDGLVGATDGELEFTVDVHHVARDLRCGDAVRVTRGQFTGRVGLILHIGLGGSLEIWDVCDFRLCFELSSNPISQAERGDTSVCFNLRHNTSLTFLLL